MKLTKNTQREDISYIEDGETKNKNLQAVCEALAGINDGEGEATWTASNELTVTDERVLSTSLIVGLTAQDAAPVGFWYVSSKSSGEFTITSTETEEADTKVNYIVINL